MKRRDDRAPIFFVGLAPKRGDAFFGRKQLLGGGVANREDHLWLEVGKLALHKGPTGGLFFSRWRSILWWPAAHHIGNGQRLGRQAQLLFNEPTQQHSRTSNKGHTGFIFFGPWCFTNNEESVFAITNANDGLRASGMKTTRNTGVDGQNELWWCGKNTAHRFVTSCDGAPGR